MNETKMILLVEKLAHSDLVKINESKNEEFDLFESDF